MLITVSFQALQTQTSTIYNRERTNIAFALLSSLLKGLEFFTFTKGMLVMLLQNTNTSAGLVNGMTRSAEEVILDRDVRGIRKALFYNSLTNLFYSFVVRTRRLI